MLLLSLFALLIASPHIPLQTGNTAPVSLEVLFDGVPEYGGVWVLTITLEAREDLEKAEIWVEKSKGLSIKSGSPFWNGTLQSGDEAVIELSFTLVGSLPQDLTVNLLVRTTAGKRFTKQVHRNIEYRSQRL